MGEDGERCWTVGGGTLVARFLWCSAGGRRRADGADLGGFGGVGLAVLVLSLAFLKLWAGRQGL